MRFYTIIWATFMPHSTKRTTRVRRGESPCRLSLTNRFKRNSDPPSPSRTKSDDMLAPGSDPMSNRFQKHYTRDEARALLPQVRLWLEELSTLRRDLERADKRLSSLT